MMYWPRDFDRLLPALGWGWLVLAAAAASGATQVHFNRDIRPILSDRCFLCHGPDEGQRESGLRLDQRESALQPAESGAVPIVPHDIKASELVRRIFAEDADEVMPPPTLNKPLTPAAKELLRRWVAEGAVYQQHWSFTPLTRSVTPQVRDRSWPRNPVDYFILALLEREELTPSPAAAWTTLLRRLSLDLTGLPPTPDDTAAFASAMAAATTRSDEDHVYAKWVERLLASPHYGERMAVDWLDAARYADSNGYQVDRDREMYAWRDWVINAFNANQPFDQFTIEQLAGDLLPKATLQQKIATGFHRNHMLNEEGGIIAEEFLAEYCSDRVETTATVWLGQTFNCCRCHDHKFDPFTQEDYYGLYAFFHNIAERGVGDYGAPIRRNAPPMLKLPAPELEAKLESLNRELAQAKSELAQKKPQVAADHPARRRLEGCVTALTEAIEKTNLQIPTTLIMEEMSSPRNTFVLIRGAYNKKGAEVTAAPPAVLPSIASDAPRNRLGLAQWLVDPANPLTARVTVNRLWQSVFGTGLVRTAENFGTQGEAPSHPELLDWLAVEFIESGWDVKAIVRLLVMSSTYRQSSRLTSELRERDPMNRLLARGPRFRLQAEFVRDQALAASGLLVTKMGGPSVRPYHPPGLYEQVVSGSSASTYVLGKGDELYRRSLYTYWKRSVPNPALLAFDAPFRELCTVRRSRTNTPLQALNLMNDPTYVEAARFLAQRMIREGGATTAARIARGYQLVLGRLPHAAEAEILSAAYARVHAEFQVDGASAEALLKVGETPADHAFDTAQLAAMTTVASTLLNLDETVTKE